MAESFLGALSNGGGHWQQAEENPCPGPAQSHASSVRSPVWEATAWKKKEVWSFLMDSSAEHPPPVKCGQEGNVRAWELQDGVGAACVFGTAAAAASGALRPVVMPSVWGGR